MSFLEGALPRHLPNLLINSGELPLKRQHIRSLTSPGFRIPLYTENRSERTRSRAEKPIFLITGIILPNLLTRELLLRDILQRIPEKFVQLLTGKKGIRIFDNTFPSIKERKADLVVELEDRSIFHLELQTHPDKNMPLRIPEYRILLMQKYPDRKIHQMVFYVGEGAPRMENSINQPNLSFSYELRDIKELSCKELMESPDMEDKILAVLCNVGDPYGYFENLFQELLKLPEKERANYIKKLLIALQYRPKSKSVPVSESIRPNFIRHTD